MGGIVKKFRRWIFVEGIIEAQQVEDQAMRETTFGDTSAGVSYHGSLSQRLILLARSRSSKAPTSIVPKFKAWTSMM